MLCVQSKAGRSQCPCEQRPARGQAGEGTWAEVKEKVWEPQAAGAGSEGHAEPWGARREEQVFPCAVSSPASWGVAACVTGLCWSRRYAGVLLDEDVFQGKELVDSRPLQALVAGLKAYSTWENIRCLQDCRECTGGMVSPEARPVGRRVTARVGSTCARRKPRLPCGPGYVAQPGRLCTSPSSDAAGPI